MTSTVQESEASLMEQLNRLASPPKISLQILGTHTTSEQVDVVDFDLWVDWSNKAKISHGEFLTSNESDRRSWDQSDESSDSLLTTSYGWLNDWLGGTNSRRSWTIQNLVCLRDDDSASMKTYAERLARQTAYGGFIRVVIHTPPLKVGVLPDEHTAMVRAEWSPGDQFISPEKSWDKLVMNAMVDRRRGFISVDEPLQSYGMSPLRRAMKTDNTYTIVSETLDERGSGHSVLKFWKWGCD